MTFSLIAALDSTTILSWIDVIVKVAVGLGAVIFVHELGHFLVAKACGVKIEKFMIGFDIGGYKLSWRRGETEYGIGILPLGGYVKMLGQDDDPAHIAEQMQKSQVSAASADAVEITGPDGEKYFVDRRSYLAKSVPQRMAIISAGVVMNVVFAFVFAVVAYGMGVPYQPCIVSEAMPGSPAWRAGIEPGDEIVQIGEQKNPTFTQLRGDVTLGDHEHGIRCVVRRAADGKMTELLLKPEQGRGLAKIGVAPPSTITMLEALPTRPDSPADRAKFVSLTGRAANLNVAAGHAKFQGGGTVVRVGDVAIDDFRGWMAELARQPDRPLLVAIRRTMSHGNSAVGDDAPPSDIELETSFEVPVQRVRQFGMIMKMGAITAIQPDSPAAEAGLAPGDRIETVDGKPISDGGAGAEGWDPVTLPDYLRAAAAEDRPVEFVVSHPADSGAAEHGDQQRTVRVQPRVPTVFHSALPPDSPLGAPAIGIAYRIENTVHAVAAEGPADKAGIRPGDKIVKAAFLYPQDAQGYTPDAESIDLTSSESNWPAVFTNYQMTPEGTVVELTIQRQADAGPHRVKFAPLPADGLFVADRGFHFEPIVRIREAATFAEQVRYGWDETADALTLVVRFLRKLGTQVPISALGGPVTIAKAAGYSASAGLPALLVFLTVLSANLAVLNFLPIPLLDGGHMVFLAYEWIRGRPANEKFVVALHTAGFLFIVTLMLYVLALDFNLIPRNL